VEIKNRELPSLFEAINQPISGEILRIDFLFVLSLILIGLQVLLGAETGIKTSGMSFQLFEIGKILLAIYLADWLFREEENKFIFPFWLPYFLTFIPFVALIFTIGVFSPTIVFLPLLVTHFLLLRTSTRNKFLFIFTGLFLSGLIVFYSLSNFQPPEVVQRILSWIYPGIYTDKSEQFTRAFWLFKGGGLQGSFPEPFQIAHFVPLVQFDFALSLFTANFGFLGDILLFVTVLIPSVIPFKFIKPSGLSYEGIWNFYSSFFLTLLFISQAAIPFLILTGLLPVMGQPFPFFSKANSNLLFFSIPYFLFLIYGTGDAHAQ